MYLERRLERMIFCHEMMHDSVCDTTADKTADQKLTSIALELRTRALKLND